MTMHLATIVALRAYIKWFERRGIRLKKIKVDEVTYHEILDEALTMSPPLPNGVLHAYGIPVVPR